MRPHRSSVAVLAALSVLSLAALGGCSDSGGGSATGEDVFRKNCATCHGTDGGGALGPDLHGVAERLSRGEHVDIVREGDGQMPSFSSSLSDAEIEKVVDYERTLGGPPPGRPGGPPASDGGESPSSGGSVPVPGGD